MIHVDLHTGRINLIVRDGPKYFRVRARICHGAIASRAGLYPELLSIANEMIEVMSAESETYRGFEIISRAFEDRYGATWERPVSRDLVEWRLKFRSTRTKAVAAAKRSIDRYFARHAARLVASVPGLSQ